MLDTEVAFLICSAEEGQVFKGERTTPPLAKEQTGMDWPHVYEPPPSVPGTHLQEALPPLLIIHAWGPTPPSAPYPGLSSLLHGGHHMQT